MRVAIIGAGIGGPTLAYWLRRLGHEPILFEKAPAPRTGGYVIDFWGLGYDLAERMGILPALIDRGYLMQRLSMVDADGHEEAGMDVAGSPLLVRPRLRRALASLGTVLLCRDRLGVLASLRRGLGGLRGRQLRVQVGDLGGHLLLMGVSAIELGLQGVALSGDCCEVGLRLFEIGLR